MSTTAVESLAEKREQLARLEAERGDLLLGKASSSREKRLAANERAIASLSAEIVRIEDDDRRLTQAVDRREREAEAARAAEERAAATTRMHAASSRAIEISERLDSVGPEILSLLGEMRSVLGQVSDLAQVAIGTTAHAFQDRGTIASWIEVHILGTFTDRQDLRGPLTPIVRGHLGRALPDEKEAT